MDFLLLTNVKHQFSFLFLSPFNNYKISLFDDVYCLTKTRDLFLPFLKFRERKENGNDENSS